MDKNNESKLLEDAINALVNIFRGSDQTWFLTDMLKKIKERLKDNTDSKEKLGLIEEVRSLIKRGDIPKAEDLLKRIVSMVDKGSWNLGETLAAELVIGVELVIHYTYAHKFIESAKETDKLKRKLNQMDKLSPEEIKPYEIIMDVVKSEAFYFVYEAVGISYLEVGRFFEAEEYLYKAIKLHPKKGNLYKLLSDVKSRQKDFNKAYLFAKKAIDIEGDNATAPTLGNMAYVCIYLNKLDEARKWNKLSMEKEPHQMRCINNMGLIAELENDFEEACLWYNRARDLDPRNPIIIANLERVQRKLSS